MALNRLTRLTSIALFAMAGAGCDPNPNGPSAPSATPEEGTTPVDVPAKSNPLKRVGAPIGMVGPRTP